MARGVNKVILLGNVGNDPEIRSLPSGSLVATFSLATSEVWNDRQTGARQEKTEWHRVVFFARLAEVVQEYVRKGSQLYIEGRLRTQKWQDQQGNNRYTTEVLGNEMQMLGRPSNEYSSNQAYKPNYEADIQQGNYGVVNQTGAYAPKADNKFDKNANPVQTQTQSKETQDFNDGGFDSYDDEIPF